MINFNENILNNFNYQIFILMGISLCKKKKKNIYYYSEEDQLLVRSIKEIKKKKGSLEIAIDLKKLEQINYLEDLNIFLQK